MDLQHHMEAEYLIERNRVREHELRAIRVHRDRNSPLHGLTQDDAAKRHKRLLRLDRAFLGSLEDLCAQQDFRRYQSGQPTVFIGTYIITVLLYIYTWLILYSETVFFVRNLEPRCIRKATCEERGAEGGRRRCSSSMGRTPATPARVRHD